MGGGPSLMEPHACDGLAAEDPSRPLLSEPDDLEVTVDRDLSPDPIPASCFASFVARAPSTLDSPWMAARFLELEACAEQTSFKDAEEGPNCVVQAMFNLLAGVLLWLVTLSLAVGFATFSFLEMPSRTPLAISMQVLGSSVVYLWLSARSYNPASCVQASPIPAIYISMFIQATRATGMTEAAQLSTVLAFIWLVTLGQGLAFVACARFKMGKVLQYFPVSVTTGYNGGIGLLIGNASISMMSGVNPLKDPATFMTRQPLLLAAPGILLASIVYPLSLTKACSGASFKVLPIMIVIGSFYLVLLATGTSVEEARDQGWIFPYFGYSKPTDVIEAFHFNAVDWNVLGQSALTMGPPATFIAMIAQYASLGAVLMQISESTKDADDETRHLGQASIVSGLVGAMPNLSGMAPSTLLMALVGAKGATGLTLAVCGTLHMWLFVSGFPLVSYLPKCSIAGCLLMPISFRMVRGALFESLASSTWADYGVIWVMSWTTLFMNIQWGLSAGFILTVFQMLVEYSHFDVVNRRECLRQVCTAKERDPKTRELLDFHGDEVVSYRLKGVLFFGNCVSLKLELNALFDGAPYFQPRPPKYIVVDFSEVSYVDSSVWEVLAGVSRRAKSLAASEVILCGLSGPVLQELACQGEKLLSDMTLDMASHSYHHAMELLEDRILIAFDDGDSERDGWAQLAEWIMEGLPRGGSADEVAAIRNRLEQYFHVKSYTNGDMVQQEGSEAAFFFWVQSGEFHLFCEKQQQPKVFGTEPQSPASSDSASPQVFRRRGSLGVIVGPAPVISTGAAGISGMAETLLREAASNPSSASQKALLQRKLTNGFIAGTEVFIHKDVPVISFTSLQCKLAGVLFCLAKADFARMRMQDPELCLALLLVASSLREGSMRRYLRYRYEPEEVEVVHGIRRKFTIASSTPDVMTLQSKGRRGPFRAAFNATYQAFASLRSTALRARNEQAPPPNRRASAWQLDAFH